MHTRAHTHISKLEIKKKKKKKPKWSENLNTTTTTILAIIPCVAREKKGNSNKSKDFGNVSSPVFHATMHKSVYVNMLVDKFLLDK